MLKIVSIFLAITCILSLTGPSVTSASQPLLVVAACGSGPVQTSLISQMTTQAWADWIRRLTGEVPVQVNGQTVSITNRTTVSMFKSGAPNPSAAFEYVLQQVREWYPEAQITQQSYPLGGPIGNPSSFFAKNLIVELPGRLKPDEIVVLSAHLDTYGSSPGAEDNGSGSAALLEAARLLRTYQFDRTIQIIWFTAEEAGLLGSSYYVTHLPAGRAVVGNVNLDMFGYDSDNDHCFELHVGTRPASDVIGQCFLSTIQSNGLELYLDYLTQSATGSSDHASFWLAGLGAVEVLENHFSNNLPGGCTGSDPNPFYHSANDKIEHMNLAAGAEIARAGVITAANLAGSAGVCTSGPAAAISAARTTGQIQLTWDAVPNATGYRIWRSSQSCTAGWETLGDVAAPAAQPWLDTHLAADQAYVYQVQALGLEICAITACTPALWPNPLYFPVISR